MKKYIWVLLMVLSSVLMAEESTWKLEASYGLGFAGYSEEGVFAPVKSDWSAFAADLMFEAQFLQGPVFPFIRVHLTGTDQDTETWKEQGVVVQENDLSMTGVDFTLGIEIPQELKKGTLGYVLGLTAGFQNFERENFLSFNGDFLYFAPRLKVTELVETYGVGGGLSYEFPLNEEWSLGVESSVYWLYYTYAYNDGFDTGIEGDGGLSWESGLWVTKRLKKPHQSIGAKLFSDLQWTDGRATDVEGSNRRVEWPDSEWQHFSLSLFWRGEF